jgi:alpha-1,6-mannosyltransferase
LKRRRSSQVDSNDRNRRAVAVYIGAVAAVAGLLAIQTWNGAFGSDVYAHLAVFREVAEQPLDPLNPYVASTDPAHYFSPYSIGLGLVGWVTSAAPITLLFLGAAINIGLLAAGLWLFSRSFSTNRWTPHLTLFFTLLAWGIGGYRWSGFLGLNSIGFGLGYPSVFATGIALIALAGLCRYLTNRKPALLVFLGFAAAVIILTHLYTALWTAIAAVAILASQSIHVLRRTLLGLVGAACIASVLVLLWPYWSIFSLVSAASTRSDAHEVLYRDLWLSTFLLIPGLVAIANRARRNLRDPLVLMAIAGLAVFFIGYVAGSYGLGRAIPLIALSSHVALADLTAAMITDEKTRRSGIAVVGVIGVIGMLGTSQGWVQMIPRVLLPDSVVTGDQLRDYISPYRSIESVLGPTDIAFGSPWMNKVVPSVTGRVVVPGHLTPLLSDRMEREDASDAFFDSDQSTAERNAIAAQWGATHVVVQPDDVPSFPWLARDYSLASETDAYVVFLIEPGSGDR